MFNVGVLLAQPEYDPHILQVYGAIQKGFCFVSPFMFINIALL